jgi:hypothetical protein
MANWGWLEQAKGRFTWGFGLRVLAKAAVLFVALNVIFALIDPMDTLGRISLYNRILPGRERLPYGENAAQSYNISLFNIPAMFAAHEISADKADDEFRVLLMGDSSTWGWLLDHDETLAAQINAGEYVTDDGRRVVAYNVGYPIMSLTKDVLLIDYAMRYQPDMVVWLITAESFPRDRQLEAPIVRNNRERVQELIEMGVAINPDDPQLIQSDFWDKTLIGQRRELADLLRLQAYGFSWKLTGIDQFIPDEYELRSSDFDEDVSWHEFDAPQDLTADDLAFDVLAAGIERIEAAGIPVLLVNEPMFISDGENSDLRYNFFYPRWAYDGYRQLLTDVADERGWTVLDLWDALPPDDFTDSPVHTTPEGARRVAEMIAPMIQDDN